MAKRTVYELDSVVDGTFTDLDVIEIAQIDGIERKATLSQLRPVVAPPLEEWQMGVPADFNHVEQTFISDGYAEAHISAFDRRASKIVLNAFDATSVFQIYFTNADIGKIFYFALIAETNASSGVCRIDFRNIDSIPASAIFFADLRPNGIMKVPFLYGWWKLAWVHNETPPLIKM